MNQAGTAWLRPSVVSKRPAPFASFSHLTGDSFNAFGQLFASVDQAGSVTVKNPLGKLTTYHIEKIAGRRKVVRVEGEPTTYCQGADREKTYTANGLIETRTDWQGTVTHYQYDTKGRRTAMTEAKDTPVERTTTTTWNDTHNQQETITEPGRTTAFTYTPDGKVHTRTVGNRTWTYAYTPDGLMKSLDGPRTDVNDTTTFAYLNGRLTRVTNPLGHEVNLSHYNDWNLPEQMTDANGVVTELTYDDRGRLIARTVKSRQGDATTTFQVDDRGLITAITLPDHNNTGQGATLFYEYDDARRLTTMSNDRDERIEYSLDPMGNRTREIIKSGSGSIVYTHNRLFDELGRLIEDIGAQGQRTKFTYDVNDNNTGITDPKGNPTAQAFDPLDRLKTITDPYNNLVTFAYDDRDNPTQVTDQRNLTTTYQYNEHNQVTTLTSPDTGTTTFTYDEAGNIQTATDARGIVIEYSYDALNRVTARHYPGDPSRDVVYSYDDHNTDPVATPETYNAGIGRLTGFSDHSGSTLYRYDDRGNLIEDTRTINNLGGQNRTFTTLYQYDLANNLARITYDDGTQITYNRNALGEVDGIDLTLPNQSTQTLASNISYQPFGGVKSLTWGNGLTLNRTFDQDYRLQTHSISGIQELDYGYDLNSNIEQIGDNTDQRNSGSYQYDSLNRLVQEIKDEYQQEFQYDAIGNREELATTESGQVTTQSNVYGQTSNRLIERDGITQTYDEVGNLINDGEKTFTYDVSNRMREVSQGATQLATYGYNALGQRTLKTRPTSTTQRTTGYLYNPAGQLITEVAYDNTNSSTHTKHYVWLGTMPIAMVQPAENDPNQQIVYLHPDHLDTTRKASDNNQQIVWEWHSDAFGTDPANDDSDNDGTAITINLRFPGQYYDQETGLHYNYFRDYDPAIGRYVQSDPIGLDGGMNTYIYAAVNPLMYIDLKGLHHHPAHSNNCAFGDAWCAATGRPDKTETQRERNECIAACFVLDTAQTEVGARAAKEAAERWVSRSWKVVIKRVVQVATGPVGVLWTVYRCKTDCTTCDKDQ